MQLTFAVKKRTKVSFCSSGALRPLFHSSQVIWDKNLPFSPAGSSLGGEKSKTWRELEKILARLSQQKIDRAQPLVAVGGGALLDLAALAASLHKRGMPLVLVPSTLLAMVDAAVGGKTAIDHSSGLKNFAGTFYPADEVWICVDLLKTLPLRERISGAGECFKTFWLFGAPKKYFETVSQFVHAGTLEGMEAVIRHCLKKKIQVVKQDPLDVKRIRESLNFGHTVGHALEALAGGRLSHGEAVLWGMAVEAEGNLREEILLAISGLGLVRPKEFRLPWQKWENLFRGDKKMKGGFLEYSVPGKKGALLRKKIRPAGLAKAVHQFAQL